MRDSATPHRPVSGKKANSQPNETTTEAGSQSQEPVAAKDERTSDGDVPARSQPHASLLLLALREPFSLVCVGCVVAGWLDGRRLGVCGVGWRGGSLCMGVGTCGEAPASLSVPPAH